MDAETFKQRVMIVCAIIAIAAILHACGVWSF